MASNAGPIYGEQVIRNAETYEVGSAEAFELRLLSDNNGTIGVQAAASSGTVVTLGVNQAYIAAASENPQASRLATVATSGLLLVEADPATVPAVRSALKVDSVGRATSGGTAAVTVNGTTPIVRKQVLQGGRSLVLVSFT
jgi:hypothetical protein